MYCQALQALGIVDLNPAPVASAEQQAGRGVSQGSRLGGARAALRKAGGWFKGFKAGSQGGPKASIRDEAEVSTPKMVGAQRMQSSQLQQAQEGGAEEEELSMADVLAEGRPLLVSCCTRCASLWHCSSRHALCKPVALQQPPCAAMRCCVVCCRESLP